MKKVITAIIAILYLGSASGVALEIHYCMGKTSGIEIYGSDSKRCSKCGMTEKKGCCNEKHQFYKIQDAHEIALSTDINIYNSPVICSDYSKYTGVSNTINPDKNLQNNSPPHYTKPSYCIMNCVFRL